MKLNQLENLHDRFLTIPVEEWDAAADVVIAKKRRETGNPKWLPRPLNGRLEFVKRTIALVEEKHKERRAREARGR